MEDHSDRWSVACLGRQVADFKRRMEAARRALGLLERLKKAKNTNKTNNANKTQNKDDKNRHRYQLPSNC